MNPIFTDRSFREQRNYGQGYHPAGVPRGDSAPRPSRPPGPPQQLVAGLHAGTIKAFQQPRMKEILAANSAEGDRQTPARLRDLLAKDVRDWSGIIRSTGVRIG
jgi:hypothetical protein